MLKYLPVYVACFGLPALLWQRPTLLLVCYAAASLLVLLRFHSRKDLVYYFVPFFLGPLGELAPVAFGAWSYAESDFLVPAWLPFGWGLAAVFMRRTTEAVLGAERAEEAGP